VLEETFCNLAGKVRQEKDLSFFSISETGKQSVNVSVQGYTYSIFRRQPFVFSINRILSPTRNLIFDDLHEILNYSFFSIEMPLFSCIKGSRDADIRLASLK